MKPHDPLKFKPRPPRTPAGSFVSRMIKAVNATKTKTMGRWVEGEKEGKANDCVVDESASETRKESGLRREFAPVSMSPGGDI